MIELLVDPHAWVALATLTLLEIVLGVDNIIFLTILVGKLPPEQQGRARFFGLALAMLTRIALLFALTWLMRLTQPWFHVLNHGVSGRDLILLGGGLFLLAKASMEIHASLEEGDEAHTTGRVFASLWAVVIQISVIDIVFSLDSVITAVGLVNDLPIMVAAIVIAVGIMMVAAKPIGDFVDANPTIKMLALAFLVMIGGALVAESIGVHVPKGYMYFAMTFSVAVEMINLRLRKKRGLRRLNRGEPL